MGRFVQQSRNNAQSEIDKASAAGTAATEAAEKKRSLATYGDQETAGSAGTQ